MHVPIEFDPEMHLVRELPVTSYLRREIGQPSLITYFHRELETWVVALKAQKFGEDGTILEIGMLGTGEGEGPWCSRENAQKIIHCMKTLISKAEAKKRTAGVGRRKMQQANAGMRKVRDAHQAVYNRVKQKRGALAADD